MRKSDEQIDNLARRNLAGDASWTVEACERLLDGLVKRLAKLQELSAPEQILHNEEDLLKLYRRMIEILH